MKIRSDAQAAVAATTTSTNNDRDDNREQGVTNDEGAVPNKNPPKSMVDKEVIVEKLEEKVEVNRAWRAKRYRPQ